MMRTLLLILCAAIQPELLAAAAACRVPAPLLIRVQFAGEAPREVLVESTLPSGLRLLDATSRQPIWSAGPGTAGVQQFANMDSSFSASFTAVHLDADGLHDRLYAGDRAGRIWRLDLHPGAQKNAWMDAGVLADLSVPGGGRGFVARADVARIESPPGTTWLNIAIGTANIGPPRDDHRFYVLRDSLTARRPTPLRESDLESLSPPAGITLGNTHGYYLRLGHAQVLAQALTLHGRIQFTAVEAAQDLLAACSAESLPQMDEPLSVTMLRASDGALAGDIAGAGDVSVTSLRRLISNSLPADTGVQLADSVDAAGLVHCLIGPESLAGCFLDTHPQRSWWRREDAD